MKKIKEFLNVLMGRPFGFALGTNIISLVIGIFGFRPFFEEGDDIGIALIAEGAFGTRDYHVMIENAVLGAVESSLSAMMPFARWHMVLQYLFIFLAGVCITYLLAHYKNGKIMSVCLELAVIFELYVSVQYVKTAAFITTVALLVLFWVIKNSLADSSKPSLIGKRSVVVLTILSYVILFYADMLRSRAFLMGVLFAAVVAAIDYFAGFTADDTSGGVSFAKRTFRYCIYLVPLVVMYFVLSFVDKSVYASDPEWDYFKYYNSARIRMLDRGYESLQYDKYGEELKKLGISENDAYMYITWQFADETNLTPETMFAVEGISGGRKLDIDMLKALVANIYDTLFRFNPLVIASLLVGVALLTMNGIKNRAFLVAVVDIALFTGVLFYYQLVGRWSRRVVYASLLACFVTFVYMLVVADKCIDKEFVFSAGKICIGILLVSLIAVRCGNEFDYQEYVRSDKNFPVLRMYMEEEKDTLFVADTFTMGGWYKYDVFIPVTVGALDNYVTCGGWSTASPIDHAIVEKYGYYDPFDALRRGSENVILIDNFSPERKAIYLSEHEKGPRYAADFVESVCGYNLYKVK